MEVITNPIFHKVEKIHLEFVLSHDFPKRKEVIDQINNMKGADIKRDVTTSYWIMEFRPNGLYAAIY